MRSLALKRIMDVVGAGAALMVAAPGLAAAAGGVALWLGRPVLFRQVRPGKDGEPFEILKLRSMLDATDAEGRPLPDHVRLTRFGRWLRASSLDELPELWNVLRGEMSLVGPRPLLMEYLPRYSAEQARRHAVKPGLTGWAQVNGRNALTWERKFELDCWYVDNWSNELDLKILWLTVRAVLWRDGISHDGEVTMPKFVGASEA
ncbi:MAG: sugar transferase [Myxococcales bacterium]|nr:MAG: sugar transferase [Myxococcales bacterium]